MTARQERILIYGGLVVLSAAISMVLLFCEDLGEPPSFSLIPIKRLSQGGTNITVFRLTSLERKRVTLSKLGYIEIPLDSLKPHPLRWRPWFSASSCTTNFVPTEFKQQVEFAILSPTNHVWRLQVHLKRTVALPVWKERIEQQWECLKKLNWAGMPGAWSVPSRLVLYYYAWSPELTNSGPTD